MRKNFIHMAPGSLMKMYLRLESRSLSDTLKNIIFYCSLCVACSSEGLGQTVTLQPLNGEMLERTVPLGMNITLICSGQGTLTWRFNDRDVTDDTRSDAAEHGFFINARNSTMAVFIPIQELLTTVTCLLRNEMSLQFDLPESSVTFEVFGSPDPPLNLVISREGLNLQLCWTTPAALDGETITYDIIVLNTRTQMEASIATNATCYVYTPLTLQPGCDTYKFTVSSRNLYSISDTNSSIYERYPTGPYSLQTSDVGVYISLEGDNISAMLNFTDPSPCSDFPVLNYTVSVIDNSHLHSTLEFVNQSQGFFPDFNVTTTCSDSSQVQISILQNQLLPDRVYQIHIASRNEISSTGSQPINIYTTGVQHVSAQLELNQSISLLCIFAQGSGAIGCQFTFINSVSQTPVLTLNISREGICCNRAFASLPWFEELGLQDLSSIVMRVSDIQASGIISSVFIEAEPTYTMSTTTSAPQSSSTTLSFTRITVDSTGTGATQLEPAESEDKIVIYGGAAGAALFVVLLLLLIIVTIIVIRRKKKHIYGLPKGLQLDPGCRDMKYNMAYSNVALNGRQASSGLVPNPSYGINGSSKQQDPHYEELLNVTDRSKISTGVQVNTNTPAEYEVVVNSNPSKLTSTGNKPLVYDYVDVHPAIKKRPSPSLVAANPAITSSLPNCEVMHSLSSPHENKPASTSGDSTVLRNNIAGETNATPVLPDYEVMRSVSLLQKTEEQPAGSNQVEPTQTVDADDVPVEINVSYGIH